MMHLVFAFFLAHWFTFFFVGHPWYVAAIWGNIFVIFVAGPLGWLWSKTKFWPLRPIKHSLQRLHEKHDSLHEKIDDLHDKHDDLHETHREHALRLKEHTEMLRKIADHLGIDDR